MMLQPSKQYERQLLRNERIIPRESSRTINRSERILRGIGRYAGIPFLGTSLVVSGVLSADIQATKERFTDTPALRTIENPSSASAGTLFADGWGSKNPSYHAKKLAPALKTLAPHNMLQYLEYADTTIDPEQIATLIANQDIPIRELNGYSIGGNVLMQVAVDLAKHHNYPITTIVLDSSPVTANDLRPNIKNDGDFMLNMVQAVNNLGFDIEYSSITRDLVADRIPSHLAETPTPLLVSQYLEALSADIPGQLKELYALYTEKGFVLPQIVYVRASDGADDVFIDVDSAAQTLQKTTNEFGFDLSLVTIDNAVHGRPDMTADLLAEAFIALAPELSERYRIDSIQSISEIDDSVIERINISTNEPVPKVIRRAELY